MAVTFAILAYDGIEPIDIGATYGVLSMAKRLAPELDFFVVSKAGGEVVMANGLRLVADHDFANVPGADVLMVLGGPGWEEAAADRETLAYIGAFQRDDRTVAAVCTGGMIVGAAGLLDGRTATTKREVFAGETSPLEIMAQRFDVASAVAARVVDEGVVVTGGGVSLGIDMTLHLLQRYCGEEVAQETARVIEYGAAWQANAARLPDYVGRAMRDT